MSEYWKSNAKKYCEFCKCWIADNKASINIHEQGKNHKDNVKAKLNDIKKRTLEKREEDRKYNATMAAIERAAVGAMEKDLAENPKLKAQYGINKPIASTAIAQATAASSSVSKPSVKKEDQKGKKDTKTAEKRKIEEPVKKKPESKIGEWQAIKEVKVETTTPAPIIDLNLPSANKMVKKIKLEAERELEQELVSIKKETDIKPQIDASASAIVVKEEAPKITEKIVTLNSGSSNKPVTFKKRRIEGQQQRQRTDD